MAWFALLPEEFKSLGKHIFAGAGFSSNLLLWTESGYFDGASITKPLLHLWSLGIEEQFYLFWPLLLWLAYHLRISPILFTLVFLLLSFALNIAFIGSDPVATFYSPISRVWELLLGTVLAWLLLPGLSEKIHRWQLRVQSLTSAQKNFSAWLGALLIVLALAFIRETSVFPGWWALLPVMGSTLLLLGGSGAWINQHILSSRVMVWFGLISFPLYLWHWPLLSFARIIDGTNSTYLRLLIALVSVLLAWLTYRFIERPLRFGRAASSPTFSRRLVWVLMFLMSVVAYMGYAAYIRDGIPVQRMLFGSSNPVLNEILTYKFKTGPAWEMGDCYLTEQQSADAFKECGLSSLDPKKPTIVLWGDSHAAHLYPGFKQVYGGQYNLVYRSASACPPILQLDKATRPYCQSINDKTFAVIKKLHPEIVVLAGNWRDNPWLDLSRTIGGLKGVGVQEIELIGPVPVWENNLPKQVFLYCRKNTPCEVPQYMKMGLVPQVFALDRQMAAFAQQEKVQYFSPLNVLCKDESCMVRVGAEGKTITAWDSEHLTDAGAIYLISHLELTTQEPKK